MMPLLIKSAACRPVETLLAFAVFIAASAFLARMLVTKRRLSDELYERTSRNVDVV